MIPDCAQLFVPLHDVLNASFYPALLGGHVSEVEVHLFALPARYGGLGVSDPVESAPLSYVPSTEGAVVMPFLANRDCVLLLIMTS